MRYLASTLAIGSFVLLSAMSLAADDPPPRTPLPTPPPEAPSTNPAGYPQPAPPADLSTLGLGIQRTMTLLATSTPQRRNHVRVLFYGQSITEQEWSKQVAGDLRRRFPNSDLEIENRAIGGFASQLLIRPAEHDLYPFYPDLLIFHVFGANQEYEQIIRRVRSRTTAEVLIQTDRITQWPPAVINKEKDKGSWWDDFMNHHFLPATAKKYGCGLCDIHEAWLDYLKVNRLEPKDLLVTDVTHLNVYGNWLMAQLTNRYLVYRPELPDTQWKDLTHTFSIGQDARWTDGKLRIEFIGNRVDLLPSSKAAAHHRARVLIDGKTPSKFIGAYRITRPQPGPWSPLFLSRVDHVSPLETESWTLKLTTVSPDGKRWEYDVTGSATGPDGSGSSDKPFTSRSGRVQIDPAAWFRGFNPPLPNRYEITWKALPMFIDTYESAKIDDPTNENCSTIVQGIPNDRHTLELIAENPNDPPALLAVRTYCPLGQAE